MPVWLIVLDSVIVWLILVSLLVAFNAIGGRADDELERMRMRRRERERGE